MGRQSQSGDRRGGRGLAARVAGRFCLRARTGAVASAQAGNERGSMSASPPAAAPTCHGRSEADGKIVRQDELMTLAGRRRPPAGAHSRAWRVLSRTARAGDRRAARHRRGDQRADVPRLPRRPRRRRARAARRFQPSDGVGCEACHGAASGWLSSHYAVGAHPRRQRRARHGPARKSAGARRASASTAISAAPSQGQFVDPPDHGRRPSAHRVRARPVLDAAAASQRGCRLSPRARAGPTASRCGRSARRWRWSARSACSPTRSAAPRASSPNSISSTATPATAGSRTIRASSRPRSTIRRGRSRRACRRTMTRT